jgi:RHS repeat-associated protein
MSGEAVECTGEIEMGSGQSPWDLPTIRFPGQYYDAETGLHYNRFRYYDPSIGRYVSADPIGQIASGDPNLYAYVWNDPINYIDPSGLMRLPGDPSGLGSEWTRDPSHRDPNGERYRDPSGRTLDYHKGRPGEKGWKGKDHWHDDGGDEHLVPGDEIPDPAPSHDPSGDPTSYDYYCAKNPNVCAAGALTAWAAWNAAKAAAAVCGGVLVGN